jgi:hypothetical protein
MLDKKKEEDGRSTRARGKRRTGGRSMYGYDRSDRDSAGNAVDLSFSQILEAHSWQQQQQRRRPKASSSFTNGNGTPATARRAGAHQHQHQHPSGGRLHALSELDEEDGDGDAAPRHANALARSTSSGGGYRARSDTEGEPTDDEDWSASGAAAGSKEKDAASVGRDVYRFVQPRRLSSWVQDDAVNACFKCHALFTFVLRKHHCRYALLLYLVPHQ